MKSSHWRIWRSTIVVQKRNYRHRLAVVCNGVIVACLVVALSLLQAAYAGNGNGKGKPGGGDDPPPPLILPDVRYQVIWLDYLDWYTRASDVNTAGNVVGMMWSDSIGDSRALLYTASLGVVDLNDLAGAIWTDLDAAPGADPATGWVAEYALKINESNQVSGRAQHSETGDVRAFILIDTFSAPQFLLLPNVRVDVSYVFLNDLGDVLATVGGDPELGMTTILYTKGATPTSYTAADLRIPTGSQADINNAGVVVTWTGYRYSPWLGTIEYFPGHSFYAVNNGVNGPGTAEFTGHRDGKKGKNGYDEGAIRYSETDTAANPVDLKLVYSDPVDGQGGQGRDINDSNDVCLRDVNIAFLYTDVYGLLPLDDLIDDTDGSKASWTSESQDRLQIVTGISNREFVTGFGYICGRIQNVLGGDRGFALKPVPYVAP